jgi:Fe-S-cluster containining protein
MGKSKNNSTGDREPWYQDGLRFKCSGCGDCCTGSPGYVWVNQAEIDAMAAHLEMTPAAFEKKFVRQVGIRRSLKELPRSNYDCVLFNNQTRQCQVYEQRPRQCRTWPFWDSNIRTPQAWEQTCQDCPGSGKGKVYQLEAIAEQAAVIKI